MKNTAINTLGYTGTVTLSRYIGSKKIKIAQVHNTGGSPLFDFFSECLLGNFDVAKIIRPNKIMFLKYEDIVDEATNTEARVYSRVSGIVSALTAPEKVYSLDNNKSTVRYSFMVSRDMLESLSDFNSIGLYTNNSTEDDYANFAAFCPVNITKNDISSSSVLVIDWELSISNKNS